MKQKNKRIIIKGRPKGWRLLKVGEFLTGTIHYVYKGEHWDFGKTNKEEFSSNAKVMSTDCNYYLKKI